MKHSKLFVIALISIFSYYANAQIIISESIGDEDRTIRYEEVNNNQTTNYISLENYQQIEYKADHSFEISVIKQVDSSGIFYLECTALKNKAHTNLNIQVMGENISALSAELYNKNGQLIESYELDRSSTLIPLINSTENTYFLKVYNNASASSTEIKTFKIQKS